MPTYEFTLIVDGPDLQDEQRIDALYESGCDDALVGRSHGVQYLDFDREASSLEDSVLSAVAEVERVEGVEVARRSTGSPRAPRRAWLTAARIVYRLMRPRRG